MTKYSRGESASIRKMFSAIAGRYDVLNRILSLGTDVRWRRELAAEVLDGGPVLDLATGTGDVALTLRDRLGRKDCIVGVDFAIPMLHLAAAKSRKHPETEITLIGGDAMHLPFLDGVFRSVTIAFGLRNLPDRVLGLREMVRVLAPGGRLVILEFSPMDHPLLGRLFRLYFHRILPVLGGIVSGSYQAYRYLPRSVGQFPDPLGLAREMMGAGFQNVKYRPLSFGIACIHVGEKTVSSLPRANEVRRGVSSS